MIAALVFRFVFQGMLGSLRFCKRNRKSIAALAGIGGCVRTCVGQGGQGRAGYRRCRKTMGYALRMCCLVRTELCAYNETQDLDDRN